MVPAWAEYQPILLDKPEVLVLHLPRGRVNVLVGYLASFLGAMKDPSSSISSRCTPKSSALEWPHISPLGVATNTYHCTSTFSWFWY